MNEWIEGGDATSTTVSVWTPWGEQKVLRGLAHRAASRGGADAAKRRDDIARARLPDSAGRH